MMNSFAIFRLPHAETCTLIKGDAVVVPSLLSMGDQQGFLIAPFIATEKEPIVLIQPEELQVFRSSGVVDDNFAAKILFATPKQLNSSYASSSYAIDFSTFHKALTDGLYQKLVLARCATILNDSELTPITLFHRACHLYPRMFVALVSTPQSGMWLIASPEILLEKLPDSRWRTIALAGTMRLRSDKADDEGQRLRWSAKNIQEQRYVASYLSDVLRQFSNDVSEDGPRTVRAGHLVHLRSDFTFALNNKCTRVGELLNALHPTPAVCGLPKAEAQDFIISHEKTPRLYYSGFMGPFNMNEKTNQKENENVQPTTHLYVSLRCMQITGTAYQLYAGGGLLRESNEQQEWLETEAKMDTMRHLLKP